MKSMSIKIIILFLILNAMFISRSAFAAGGAADGGSSSSSLGLGNLEDYAQQQGTSTMFEQKVDVILGVVQIIGSLCSVICLIVLGIKYMMGSVEEKANYKKTLIPYILGAIMVLGISNFINFIYEVATGIF